jgi:hypothetical protein
MSLGLDAFLKSACVPAGESVRRPGALPIFTIEIVLMALLTIPFITHRAEYLETRIALGLMLCFMAIFFAGLLVGHITKSRIPVAVSVFIVIAMQMVGFEATSSESLLARSAWNDNILDLKTISEQSDKPDEATMIAIRTQASVRIHERILRYGVRAFEPGPHLHIDHLGSANAGLMENLTVCNADLPLELARWERLIHRGLWDLLEFTDGPLPVAETNLLSVLGINWIVTENSRMEIRDFERMSDESWLNGEVPFYIYKRTGPVRPYSFYWDWDKPPEITQHENYYKGKWADFLFSHDPQTIRTACFIEGNDPELGEPVPPGDTGERHTSSVMGGWIGVTEWSGTVTTSRDGIFMLRDAWYPGWSVTVDGEPASLLKADYVFKAVHVPSGTHEVVFRYRPTYLAVGWWLSGLSLITILAVLLLHCRRRKQGAVS